MSVFRLIRRQAFALAIILCAASAYLWPGLYIEWFGVKLAPFVGPSIQLIMFGMGTTLTAADFLRVAKAPWSVAVGAVLQFSIMPLAALGVAKVLGSMGLQGVPFCSPEVFPFCSPRNTATCLA